MPEQYDIIVIGAGPGGYVAAIRAAQLGQKTAIVDKQWLGGVCLNVGCIPSKALLKNAELAHTLRERPQEFGISFDNLNLDFAAAVKRSRQVSDRLVKGLGFLMKKNKITVYMGNAHLTGPGSVSVKGADGALTELVAKNIIVATGASSLVPPAWKVDGTRIVTYLEAITQEKLPKSAIIIGAGAVGVEFATVWSAYGSEVTIVEMLPGLLPMEDEEIGKELKRAFDKRGIKSLVGHKVEAVEATGTGVKVVVSAIGGASILRQAQGGAAGLPGPTGSAGAGDTSRHEHAGLLDPPLSEMTLEAEQALVAIGFRPNSKGLGLEEIGVRLDECGFIGINECMETNVPGIRAIGDVTGKLMLAHVGSAQGIIAAEHIAGVETITLDYEMMPRATYCQPQVASFGLSEAKAKERGYAVKVGKFPFQANGKALGLGEAVGWVKLVVDEKYGEILGAHMIGPEVTELLPELTLARMLELTPHEIAYNVHAHPTLSEVLMEAAHGAEGNPINI
jgi:dihydrolipoamide dehydrogenase